MSDIYYTYASREELLAVGADSEHIYEDIVQSDYPGLQQATLTEEQCHALIPRGAYCYTRKDGKFIHCPFHDLMSNLPTQSNGFCHYLKCGDFTSPGTDLLWDSCKHCGVNDNDESKPMRELKFRLWDHEKKTMVYADGLQHLSLIVKESGKPFNQFAIQQFSGKHDIYDFPIYDGDIVELVLALQTDDQGRKHGPSDSFGVYEVFYRERSAAYFLRVHRSNWLDTWFTTEKQAAKLTIDPWCPHVTCLERELGNFSIMHVIGNIYENPELLEQ